MIRSIKRNMARQRMKEAGIEHVNRKMGYPTQGTRWWKEFLKPKYNPYPKVKHGN